MGERKEHASNLEAQQFATEAIVWARDHGSWMSVAWFITEDGKVELGRRTTYQFPKGKFAEALGLLAMDLAEEKQAQLPSPLPMARLRPFAEETQPPAADGSDLDDDPLDEEDDVE